MKVEENILQLDSIQKAVKSISALISAEAYSIFNRGPVTESNKAKLHKESKAADCVGKGTSSAICEPSNWMLNSAELQEKRESSSIERLRRWEPRWCGPRRCRRLISFATILKMQVSLTYPAPRRFAQP